MGGVKNMDLGIQRIIERGVTSLPELNGLRGGLSKIGFSLTQAHGVSHMMWVRDVPEFSYLNDYLYFHLGADLTDLVGSLPDPAREVPLGEESRSRLSYHREVLSRLVAEIEAYWALEAETPTPRRRFVWSKRWKDLIERMDSIAEEPSKRDD
jgi:hypothetical protein